MATGGVTSQGGSVDGGQAGGTTDGEIPDSSDALCDEFWFWVAVTDSMGTGSDCMATPHVDASWGDVVLNSEGRVINITMFGASEQPVVDRLANGRWPCLAGQTIPYLCNYGE